MLGTLGLAVALATLAIWLGADALVALQFPRFDPAQRALTTELTRIVLPAQLFFVCGGVVQAALMAQGRFAAQAAAPLLYNFGIILGGLLLGPTLGVAGFAWGALLGAAVGAFALPLLDARGRVPLGLRVAPLDPGFTAYLAVAAPLMAGVTLLTVDEWYSRWFGQLGGEGTIASVAYARRLMLVPVAVVGQTLATAALPTLSRLWSEGRREELDALVLRTLEAGLGLGVLGAAATWALAGPLVTARLPARRVRPGRHRARRDDARGLRLRGAGLDRPADRRAPLLRARRHLAADAARHAPRRRGGAALPRPRAATGRRGSPRRAPSRSAASALATLGLARAQHGAPHLGALAASSLRAAAVGVAVALAARAVQPGGPGALGALVDLATGGAAFLAAASAGALLASGAATRDAALALVRGVLRRLPGRAGR